jgi:hypothetical protein
MSTPTPTPSPTPEPSRIELLERLAALHDRGALTDEEFAEEKAALRRGATEAATREQ